MKQEKEKKVRTSVGEVTRDVAEPGKERRRNPPGGGFVMMDRGQKRRPTLPSGVSIISRLLPNPQKDTSINSNYCTFHL
ncbi:unnamed protein product [Caenorhabditis auriculariae]|uniref:Uncharacterized protein n=1 Tax=Caenorhabditis auriculariae TaxID=2777116 RepID=A0A8S1GT63_9PELO|nr:unnamed protein product [Caenorhabditis auriculariae]